MSKLYEAIKKIEEKERRRDEFPDFTVGKRKPPYLLIVVSILFVAAAVFSGLYFTSRFENIKHSNFFKKNQRAISVRKVKKSNGTVGKSLAVKKEIKARNTVIAEKTEAGGQPHGAKKVQKEKGLNQMMDSKKSTLVQRSKETKSSLQVKSHVVAKRSSSEKIAVKESKNTLLGKDINRNRRNQDQTAVLLRKARSGNFFESINAYKQLIKLYPGNISLYNNLAVRFMERGLYQKAIRILKKGLSVKDDPTLKLNLAICYIRIGNYDKAKAVVNTIPSGSVNSSELEKLKYYLSNIK